MPIITRWWSLRLTLAAPIVLAVVLAVPARAHAQAAAGGDDPAAAQGAKKKDRLITFKWADHPSVRVGKVVQLDFTGRLQREFNHSEAPSDESGTASLDIAKKRLGLEGTVKTYLAFQIERELTELDPWRDVYFDFTPFKLVGVQYGKFKLPFSLDENTGATNLDFAYRSLVASQLSPGRDRGWMVHGQLAGRLFDYAAGYFEHDGKNALPNNPERMTGGPTTAVRLLVHPFGSKSRFEDLRVGIAATRSQLEGVDGEEVGRSSLKGHTVLGADMYEADALVNGRRDRLGAELRWRKGPAAIRAEYIRVAEQRRGQSVEDTDLPPMVSQGWFVSGTWALTGETKSKGLDHPLHPLLRGGVGAVELAARVEDLQYGANPNEEEASTSQRSPLVLGNRDRVVTLGVNWYPFRSVKIQANVLRERLMDPSRGPLPGQSAFWSQVLRVQVGF